MCQEDRCNRFAHGNLIYKKARCFHLQIHLLEWSLTGLLHGNSIVRGNLLFSRASSLVLQLERTILIGPHLCNFIDHGNLHCNRASSSAHQPERIFLIVLPFHHSIVLGSLTYKKVSPRQYHLSEWFLHVLSFLHFTAVGNLPFNKAFSSVRQSVRIIMIVHRRGNSIVHGNSLCNKPSCSDSLLVRISLIGQFVPHCGSPIGHRQLSLVCSRRLPRAFPPINGTYHPLLP